MKRTLPFLLLATFIAAPLAQAQIQSHQKISDTAGGFTGVLDDDDEYGTAVANLGDLDGDGVIDLAVGAPRDDDGCSNTDLDCDQGAVWILFLNPDGTVKAHQKISETAGGFTGRLDPFDEFGTAVARLGDVDGDGVDDLAVGAPFDDEGGFSKGVVWVLFLNPDGTVKAHQKISDTDGGFTGGLDPFDQFGNAVAGPGDLDGNGTPDLIAGTPFDDDGAGFDKGAIWVLFLNPDGTVQSHQKISDTEGGFIGGLDEFGTFGASAGELGDLDGDGTPDLAVGAPLDDEGCPPDDPECDQGALWVLFLNPDGTVKAHQKIGEGAGGFAGNLVASDGFGSAVAGPGDLDGDGINDVVAGEPGDDGESFNEGAVWLLFLNPDGTVKAHQKIADSAGGFTGNELDPSDDFGHAVTGLGDLNGDGAIDLAAGAPDDDDGGGSTANRGAVWILFLAGDDPGGALTVDIEPLSIPVVIPPEGGSFRYSLTVENLSGTAQSVELWFTITAPSGQVRTRGPVAHTLEAGRTFSHMLSQALHGGAPAGTYTLTASVGSFPNAVEAEDSFTFEKQAAGARTVAAELSRGFALSSVSPNPFANQALLTLEVAEAQAVRVEVFDVRGRRVALLQEGMLAADGPHAFVLEGSDLPSGLYVVRLTGETFAATRPITVLQGE